MSAIYHTKYTLRYTWNGRQIRESTKLIWRPLKYILQDFASTMQSIMIMERSSDHSCLMIKYDDIGVDDVGFLVIKKSIRFPDVDSALIALKMTVGVV